ncbi:transposase [Microbulbifer epialgicus]|uniref:Transposase n=1 Tax=Microbulbifer epialgicus TaxID=393907 RepID=A0ABV4P2M7_9GAMM
MQLFYKPSDSTMEDALYDMESIHNFIGIGWSNRTPDEATILNFRY